MVMFLILQVNRTFHYSNEFKSRQSNETRSKNDSN